MASGSSQYAKTNAKVKAAIAERTAAGYMRTRKGIVRVTAAQQRSPKRTA